MPGDYKRRTAGDPKRSCDSCKWLISHRMKGYEPGFYCGIKPGFNFICGNEELMRNYTCDNWRKEV